MRTRPIKKTRARRLGGTLRFLAVIAALGAAGAAHAGAEVGTPAPDFTLDGHDGDTYTLSDYTPGNVVFLAHIGYS